ncbi:LppA family lipoprotein [Mycolicibacterium houstonense]|uniref:LppA family lipoprotein n=1 Tax=Mycolicibacterium houstonense TaxID=146021 RepID=UPI003F9CDAF4
MLTLAGCGHMFGTMPPIKGEGDYGYGTPKELGALLARRDAEEVLADRDRMITEIIAELSQIVPGSQWLPHRQERRSGCGEFGSTYGERIFGQIFTSEVAVPAALWNQASQAVVDIAAKYGYTNITGRTENPVGDESTDLTITDSDGGRLSFGSQANAVLQVVTGCYLTAEDKRKAREAAPK